MSAAATLTIPVALASAGQRLDVEKILSALAGAEGPKLDPAGRSIVMKYEFPGNIDGLVRRLRSAGVGVGATTTVAIPVKDIAGKDVNPAALLASLNESPAVSNAAYDGATVTATLATATNAFRYVFEEIILHGLMPLDVPTVAYPWEFVL